MAQSFFDRLFAWYKLWTPLGLLRLNSYRDRLRKHNLVDTETLTPQRNPSSPAPPQTSVRTIEGTHNDLQKPWMGAVGARFGRNIPLDQIKVPDPQRLITPSPREISRLLMTRKQFIPATTLNLLAAAWIQFQVHDWFSHGPNQHENPIEIPLKDDDAWPERPMKIRRTRTDPAFPTSPPTHTNTETHWWDGSQLYGCDARVSKQVRSFQDGKLTLGPDGLLPTNEDGVDITGVNGNWWVGLSMLHTIFTYEHNAVCDRLKQEFPSWSDEELFQRARLINAAVMAKIHTVEWTPRILLHPTLKAGLNDNWTRIRKSKAEHHAAPYSMTEEFVSVYRMHPLMPDEFIFRSHYANQELQRRALSQVADGHARVLMKEVSLTDLFYSFGTAHPGAITLHNYPKTLQNLQRGELSIDLAATDILRDRERGVPRYNQFRKLIDLDPIEKFEDLSNNPEWCEEIRRVYEDKLDDVDLMVGMYAEPLIPGFGFSETAFRIFLLMASRRLQSDRFFTTDYNERTYTKPGLQWIDDANLTTVLLRHLPELKPLLRDQENAFAPWPIA